MEFRVVDIIPDSKSVRFIFDNDDTFKLVVTTKNNNAMLFRPYGLYNIKVSHDVPFFIPGCVPKDHYFFIGVVVRKSRKSIYIVSGQTHWMFPIAVCNLPLGLDVCIHVNFIQE